MRVLGISAFYHDSAAALVVDGEVVAAAQEERFTRLKHDRSFPRNAVACCLDVAGLSMDQVDLVAFYDKPFLTFERLLETYLSFAPKGFRSFSVAMPTWLKEKLFQKRLLGQALRGLDPDFDSEAKLVFAEHHQSHAASAFFPSPFDSAAVLTIDGVGEWATTTLSLGKSNRIEVVRELHFPHSLGLLYSAFTQYLGFRVNSGEYKVMGLAPYGEPRYARTILDRLIDVKKDGTFRLDLDYFGYCTGLRMTNRRFEALFGNPARQPEDRLDSFHMDVAASVQAVTEEVVERLGRSIARETGARNLCLAGGVALNCVANGRLLRSRAFENVWIQPAAGDAGGSLGAALAAHHHHLGCPRRHPAERDGMAGAYLGPQWDDDSVAARLAEAGARFHRLADAALMESAVDALVRGCALGWFQGRMEFGPRALGNRSILGDPRSPAMQRSLNQRVKFRESFRPFAPSVLCEDVSDWFELDIDSPYMLLVADVREERRLPLSKVDQAMVGVERLNAVRSEIPAVTHVDHSARVQTVHRDTNPKYHALLSAFKLRTGCPVLVNTSFNVRGEPIVCTPEDAFRCFMGTDIEALAVGNCFLLKDEQDGALRRDYRGEFEPD
ncbi:MAG: carbamoyltransferase [Gammaproteobacteria bacterium]|nr:carbamoyltransferase [Gammaproteobacteria bacterium]